MSQIDQDEVAEWQPLPTELPVVGSQPCPASVAATTEYHAWVSVDTYDDDFLLICDGVDIREGTSSKVFKGPTEAAAMANLLAALVATDRNERFSPTDNIPESYHHVRHVRKRLAEMRTETAAGQLPDVLYWCGNWDVSFQVAPA